jgi:hypothetical protein
MMSLHDPFAVCKYVRCEYRRMEVNDIGILLQCTLHEPAGLKCLA